MFLLLSNQGIIAILCVMLILGLLVFAFWATATSKEIKELKDNLKKEKEVCNEFSKMYDIANKNYIKQMEKNNELITNSSSAEMISEKEERVKQLETQIQQTTAALNEVQSKLKGANDELVETTKKMGDNQLSIEALRKQKESAEQEMAQTKAKLDSLLASWKAAMKVDDRDTFEFMVDVREKKLIEVVAELKSLYPELAIELAGIEWRKIWMPKIQEWNKGNEVLGKGGIYYLELVNSPGVGYVGQAQCFKDRWYQHCKKMIGVEGKGNEKVYRYRPEDFTWSILEVIDSKEWGMKKDYVNERERFWIEGKGKLNS